MFRPSRHLILVAMALAVALPGSAVAADEPAPKTCTRSAGGAHCRAFFGAVDKLLEATSVHVEVDYASKPRTGDRLPRLQAAISGDADFARMAFYGQLLVPTATDSEPQANGLEILATEDGFWVRDATEGPNGTWYDVNNLTALVYPLLSPRDLLWYLEDELLRGDRRVSGLGREDCDGRVCEVIRFEVMEGDLPLIFPGEPYWQPYDLWIDRKSGQIVKVAFERRGVVDYDITARLSDYDAPVLILSAPEEETARTTTAFLALPAMDLANVLAPGANEPAVSPAPEPSLAPSPSPEPLDPDAEPPLLDPVDPDDEDATTSEKPDKGKGGKKGG